MSIHQRCVTRALSCVRRNPKFSMLNIMAGMLNTFSEEFYYGIHKQ